jgi:hypothetical protein
VLVIGEVNQVIGACGYVYSTPEHEFQDSDTVQLELAYMEPKYRGTCLFIRGLAECIQAFRSSERPVRRLQFNIPDDKPSERKLR